MARWFSELKSEIELLVALTPGTTNGGYITFAFRYGLQKLRLVEPANIWIDWALIALPITPNEANTSHSEAQDRALQIAEFILAEDKAISEYVREFTG